MKLPLKKGVALHGGVAAAIGRVSSYTLPLSSTKMTGVSKMSLFEFCSFGTVPRIDCQGSTSERRPKKARTDHEPVQNYTFQKYESERPGLLPC